MILWKKKGKRESSPYTFDIYAYDKSRTERKEYKRTFIKQGYRVAESTTCMNF